MSAERFRPGNRFSDLVSVAAAAVEWQGLSRDEQELVVVEDGLPYLAGVPDLADRAEAIAEAAGRRLISGFTHTEDGAELPIGRMRLHRDSLDAWLKKADRRRPIAQNQPDVPASTPASEQLLRLNEVVERLGISRSTLYRWIDAAEFEGAHFDKPARWRRSYVDAFLARQPAADSAADDI